MSMLYSLYRITPEQVIRLTVFPDAVGELFGSTTPPPNPMNGSGKLEELWSVVNELRAFFEHTVQAGNAALVSIY